ncbi:hypothetical protein EAT51_07860 [Pseudoxanthomonas winnipegensis]|uniref:hypothetical protein n=1 Tax=Pseudoxanthomonas winnipegensis TaxID=2480810 RepID=UPI00102D8D3D|nr:hypothetical protein [Pseudoxanthomonas winnipegensis]RZZ81959.1 hypothetical protein EA662_17465 [Pseudoxanthomonas winnipegensis]TAA42175.1 hypothetical protein EAT51_07860 [Pseudoxanthomonas winnipegensis]
MTTSKTTIKIDGEFSATEIEGLLSELAAARSGMMPEVPTEPPAEGEFLPQPNASFRIRSRANGGLRVWLRHEGFGWIPFELEPAQVTALRDFLGKKLGHSHTSH